MTKQLLTDPREMRKVIEQLSRGAVDIRGNTPSPMKIPMSSAMVRNCMEFARHAGLSGEDLYTLIAYHALAVVESMGAQLIDYANRVPPHWVPQKSNGEPGDG